MSKVIKSARHSQHGFFGTQGLIRQRLKLALLCASITFSAGANPSLAQTNNQAGGQNGEKDEFTLNLQDVDIRVLINTVAEVSGKNFIVDPRVKGKVSVISGASLNPEQLYDVFLSILEVHNFATVESGQVIKVVPSNVIKQRPTPTLFTPTEESNDAQITQIIQLTYASVQDLVPIVRPLIPPTSHFAPHVPSNSVVLTDTAANIQRVLKIIRKIDVPDKRSNIHVVNLDFAKASEIAATMTQLIATTADPKDAASAAKISIQPFDAINSLVISAPDDQYGKIQALIDELDIVREVEGNVNVIPLKHAKAEDLSTILRDITASDAQGGGGASEFTVQADEASNSLIVKAAGSQLKTVQNVVEQLDRRRAQVFVETIIAEVSLTQEEALGIEWGAGVDAPTTTTTDGMTTTTTSNNRLNTVGSRSGTGQASTDLDLPVGGFNYSLLDFGRYQLDVIVNAIRNDSNSNVLSTPTILTLDNEEAEIIVGQEVPFVTGTFNNGVNATTNTDGDGNTTTNTGTGFQTIERQDVGIVLRIRPQISDGDTIQLEVFQETSSISTVPVAGISDVITNRRSLEAVVQVDDGQVVALGGLITDDVIDTNSSIPFLGKLPIVGALFRSKSKNAVKRNLMVFLKPRIIRSPEDLANVSKVRYDDIRRDSLKFRNNSDDLLLLPDNEPPVLLEYEQTLGSDGEIVTESRASDRIKGEPKRAIKSKVKDIIFGRVPLDRRKRIEARKEAKRQAKEQSEFVTDDDLETNDVEQELIDSLEKESKQIEDGVGVFPDVDPSQE